MRKVLGVLVAVVALGACTSSDGTGTAVEMTAAHRFSPEELTTSVGETVTWTNGSSEAHTVTAYQDNIPDGADYFTSGGAASEDEARDALEDALVDEGETFEVTFDEPGTYQYFCIPHEEQGMVGTIIVEE